MAALKQTWKRARRGCSWKSMLRVNLRSSIEPQPRLFSGAGADVRSAKYFTGYQRYSTRAGHHRVPQREKPKDLYATLNVSPSATQQQVKDAYYKLSLKYHPDRNRGSVEAHQKFTDLTEAYAVLGQYELRKKYDKGLLHHASTTPAKKSTQFVNRDKVNFNFDEFYKAHYGEALKRQRDHKRKEQEAKINATYYSMPKLAQQMLIIGVSLSVLVVGLAVLPEPKVLAKTLKR